MPTPSPVWEGSSLEERAVPDAAGAAAGAGAGASSSVSISVPHAAVSSLAAAAGEREAALPAPLGAPLLAAAGDGAADSAAGDGAAGDAANDGTEGCERLPTGDTPGSGDRPLAIGDRRCEST